MTYKEKLKDLLVDEDLEMEFLIRKIEPLIGISKTDGVLFLRFH